MPLFEKDVDTLGALYLIVSLFIVIVILIICTIGAVTATRILYSITPNKMIRPDLLNQHCPPYIPPNVDVIVEGGGTPINVCAHNIIDEMKAKQKVSEILKQQAGHVLKSLTSVLPENFISAKKSEKPPAKKIDVGVDPEQIFYLVKLFAWNGLENMNEVAGDDTNKFILVPCVTKVPIISAIKRQPKSAGPKTLTAKENVKEKKVKTENGRKETSVEVKSEESSVGRYESKSPSDLTTDSTITKPTKTQSGIRQKIRIKKKHVDEVDVETLSTTFTTEKSDYGSCSGKRTYSAIVPDTSVDSSFVTSSKAPSSFVSSAYTNEGRTCRYSCSHPTYASSDAGDRVCSSYSYTSINTTVELTPPYSTYSSISEKYCERRSRSSSRNASCKSCKLSSRSHSANDGSYGNKYIGVDPQNIAKVSKIFARYGVAKANAETKSDVENVVLVPDDETILSSRQHSLRQGNISEEYDDYERLRVCNRSSPRIVRHIHLPSLCKQNMICPMASSSLQHCDFRKSFVSRCVEDDSMADFHTATEDPCDFYGCERSLDVSSISDDHGCIIEPPIKYKAEVINFRRTIN